MFRRWQMHTSGKMVFLKARQSEKLIEGVNSRICGQLVEGLLFQLPQQGLMQQFIRAACQQEECMCVTVKWREFRLQAFLSSPGLKCVNLLGFDCFLHEVVKKVRKEKIQHSKLTAGLNVMDISVLQNQNGVKTGVLGENIPALNMFTGFPLNTWFLALTLQLDQTKVITLLIHFQQPQTHAILSRANLLYARHFRVDLWMSYQKEEPTATILRSNPFLTFRAVSNPTTVASLIISSVA